MFYTVKKCIKIQPHISLEPFWQISLLIQTRTRFTEEELLWIIMDFMVFELNMI